MFEVRTSVTREGCRAQARTTLSHHLKEIWVVLAGLALTAVILYAVRAPRAWVAAAAFCIAALYAYLAVPLTAMRLYSSRNPAVRSIVLKFGENGVRVRTSVEDTAMEYGRIRQMDECGKYIVIYVRHHTPLVFRRDEVPDMGADDLKAFLEGKTGKSFRQVRA